MSLHVVVAWFDPGDRHDRVTVAGMIVLAVILATALAGALGLVAYLVHRGDQRADAASDARDALAERAVGDERRAFELEVVRAALARERDLTAALTEEASHAARVDSGDLDPGDYAVRSLRLSRAWSGSLRSGDQVPAGTGGDVRPGGATAPTDDAVPGRDVPGE
jgi:uncharacterized membrane protein